MRVHTYREKIPINQLFSHWRSNKYNICTFKLWPIFGKMTPPPFRHFPSCVSGGIFIYIYIYIYTDIQIFNGIELTIVWNISNLSFIVKDNNPSIVFEKFNLIKLYWKLLRISMGSDFIPDHRRMHNSLYQIFSMCQ